MVKIHGRGTTENKLSNRFSGESRQMADAWLNEREAIDGPSPALKTTVTEEVARTIITRNNSPDIPFDRSINPYRGCEHGCIYCFARPSHAYHDLSPGQDFESRLFAKPNAAKLLKAEISRPSYSPAPIAFGTNTDPFQPIEAEWGLSGACIALLSECNHPITITTKSDRVTNLLDILAPMAEKNLVAVALSITSLDTQIARTLEPRASAPLKRLKAMQMLSAAGVPVALGLSPIIPAITDHEIEKIIEACALAGATSAFYMPIRLPHEVVPLFKTWLETHYPDRKNKVMSIIRDMRGGKDNDPQFTSRMRGSGPWAELIRTRFNIACRKNGLAMHLPTLRTDLFRPPAGKQLTLF